MGRPEARVVVVGERGRIALSYVPLAAMPLVTVPLVTTPKSSNV